MGVSLLMARSTTLGDFFDVAALRRHGLLVYFGYRFKLETTMAISSSPLRSREPLVLDGFLFGFG